MCGFKARSENAMQLLLDSLSGPLLLDSGASLVALVVKNSLANAGDERYAGSTLGLEDPWRRAREYPLQYSSPENPMDRGTW